MDPGGVAGPSAVYIYIKEKTAGIDFHCLTGVVEVGAILPVLTMLLGSVHVPEGRSNNSNVLDFSVVDQRSSD